MARKWLIAVLQEAKRQNRYYDRCTGIEARRSDRAHDTYFAGKRMSATMDCDIEPPNLWFGHYPLNFIKHSMGVSFDTLL